MIIGTGTNTTNESSIDTRDEKHERGVVMLWVAGMLVALLGVSAFAVDLGWLYLNTSRLQKAADAAALAGVVNLPASPVQADVEAQGAASANKFPIGNPVSNTFASEVLPDNQYEVTLGAQVGTFFLKVVGINSFAIERVATAQYVLPVPMGSPANCFGIGTTAVVTSSHFPTGSGTATARGLCNTYTQNFWAAVSGRMTAKEQGDQFMTECLASSGGSCSGGANTEFNNINHYYYGITVPNSAPSLDVWLYDAGFYNRGDFDIDTGDNLYGSGSTSGGANTTYTLKRPDLTPYDPTDNVPVGGACTLTIPSGGSPAIYQNMWAKICNPTGPFGGTWVLHVETTGNIGGTPHWLPVFR